MPWVGGAEDDRRLRKFLAQALAAALLFGAIFPLIDIPLPEAAEIIEVPERLVELIRERRPLPPPQPVAEERPQQRAQEQQPTEPPPEQEPQQVAAEQPTEAEPTPRAGRRRDTERAAGSTRAPERHSRVPRNLRGGREPARRAARHERAHHERRRRGRRPPRARDGHDAGAGLERRHQHRLDQPRPRRRQATAAAAARRLAGSRRRASAARSAAAVAAAVAARSQAASGVAGRTDEEIQIVFDRYKAALYRLYNRELRNDPTLRGQMVLRLTIEPNGTVSFLELQSTRHECAGSRRAGARARAHVRFRREGRRADHDRVSDRFLAGGVSTQATEC